MTLAWFSYLVLVSFLLF